MSYPAYPEYKDSGIEWLGEVPAHWEVKRLGDLVEFLQGKAHEPFIDTDGKHICVNSRFVSTNGKAIKKCSANLTPALPSDVLMVMSDLPNGRALGKAYYVDDERSYAVNQRICRIRATRACSRFLFYLLDRHPSLLFKDDGFNQTHLSGGDFTKLKIDLPSKPVQAQIAAFLDYETARIDALVEEQKRLIVLLKEKRQAVISHAVTKGLDPDVSMKGSGVEWLGEVPEHWAVGPLRWYATIQGGIAKGKSYDAETPTVELPYLRVANVQDGYVDLSSVKTVEVGVSEVGRYRLQEGDVLMNEGGDNDKLGRGTVWKGEVTDCLHQNHVFAIRPNHYLLPHWLSMFTRSNTARAYFYLYSKQSTNLASISSSSVMSCPLPLPPVKEQRQVLDFLAIEAARLDDLMQESIKTINLLQERRSALISAAVTGKIDVRGWQPPGDSITQEANQQEAV